jgi:hypothetical protein
VRQGSSRKVRCCCCCSNPHRAQTVASTLLSCRTTSTPRPSYPPQSHLTSPHTAMAFEGMHTRVHAQPPTRTPHLPQPNPQPSTLNPQP